MARLSCLALCLSLLASPALAQTSADTAPVSPPPGASALAAPVPEAPPPPPSAPPPSAPPPQTVQPATGYVQPATGYAQPGAVYGQPYAGQPYAGQPVVGQPVVGQPTEPPARRGDRLEDRAAVGEVVDLMITTGGYGAVFANAIIDWSPDEVSGVPSHTTATVFGLALSLTGLLTLEAPRGVPTLMAIGLRYGALLGGFSYGAFSGNSFDPEAFLVGVTLGGVIGYGVGAGIGFGARPHVSRSRFVEAGGLWGAGFAVLLGSAICSSGSGSSCGGPSGPMGALVAGISGGVLVNTLIATLTPVSVGRGWLMNAGFLAGSGLGALVTWGFSNGNADDEVVLGVAAAVGFVGLGTIFAVTDSLQDSGWDESTEEVLSRISIGAAPAPDGAVVTASGQF